MNLNTRMVLTALVARTPLYLEGTTGTGKSTTVKTVARWLGRPFIKILGFAMVEDDFKGRTYVVQGRVRLLRPRWVEELVGAGEKGILYIDEINHSKTIFPILLQILKDKVIGDTPFQGDVIASGSPPEFSASGLVLPPSAANAVIHYAWRLFPDEVALGMMLGLEKFLETQRPSDLPPQETVEAEIASLGALVAFFVEHNPQAFSEPAERGPWPSPRSWELLTRFLGAARALGMGEEVIALGAHGAVGLRADQFLQFLRDRAQDIPNPEELLEKPSLLPNQKYLADAAVMEATGYVLRHLTPDNWDRIWRLLTHARSSAHVEHAPDLAARAARLVTKRYKGLPPKEEQSLRLPEWALEFLFTRRE